MTQTASPSADITRQLEEAIYQNPRLNLTGLQERLFARLFQDLVYAQIWEDPVADMTALALRPGADMICIASGGCNAMSYLTANPASITAVDLSPAHIALLRLKATAAQTLDGDAFFSLFARADRTTNTKLVLDIVGPHLDPHTRGYWAGRRLLRPRAAMFANNVYRHGVLGRFIGAVHLVAKLARVDFRPLLSAGTREEQRRFHAEIVDPLFDKRIVRVLARQRSALFGLGIPPAQYDKLAADGQGEVIAVLRERIRRLVCDFPVKDNYFLWQAFNRGYASGRDAAVPPYLQPENFAAIAARADRIEAVNQSLTDHLAERAGASLDAYILLDAQDWMTDVQLTDLWTQITRTARPGASVLFRTGGAADILPGRVRRDLLDRWSYDAMASARAFAEDRSAIYGGVHLYRFAG
jgi:S-adenosylmethionine-diacylglycerol 3-amino-3-carboxypropyl transferase